MGTPPKPIKVEILELKKSLLIAGSLKYAG